MVLVYSPTKIIAVVKIGSAVNSVKQMVTLVAWLTKVRQLGTEHLHYLQRGSGSNGENYGDCKVCNPFNPFGYRKHQVA